MTGLADLLHSERGVWCGGILVCATALVFLGKLSSAEWLDLVKFTTMILVGSKTVTTAVETVTLKQPQIPRAEVVSDKTTTP